MSNTAKLLVLVFGFVTTLVGGSCVEEDLGEFMCGDELCDVRSQYCYHPDQCDGSVLPPSCVAAPEACDGTADASCLSTGGLGCSERVDGGWDCSPSCG